MGIGDKIGGGAHQQGCGAQELIGRQISSISTPKRITFYALDHDARQSDVRLVST